MSDLYPVYDYQPDVTKEVVSGEAHTVPNSAPYEIRLRHIPRRQEPSTVLIPGYTEVEGVPAAGQFRVHYTETNPITGQPDYPCGRVEFHSSAAGASVSVNYHACGTVVGAGLWNAMLSAIEDSRIVEDNLDVGSPPNGHYVRWANGWQIATVMSGNVGSNGNQQYRLDWTFPAAFSSRPLILPGHRSPTLRDVTLIVSETGSGTSGSVHIVREDKQWTEGDGFIGNFIYIYAVAFGRWQ